MLLLLALFALMMAPGCLTLMGGSQKVGDEAAVQAERQMGLVDSPKLGGYVRAIGERLAAAQTDRTGPWTFKVIDDPIPNAFALPGGHVYVTRGLLALANTEDELAGVVGHEIGHVLAGHANKRITLSAPFAVVTGITSFTTGLVLPSLGRAIAAGGNALSDGFVVAPYSRQQEREADRIGQELAAKAGWDPAGLSSSLATLDRAVTLMLGEERKSSWRDTHPDSAERVGTTAAHAKTLTQAPGRPPIAPGRRGLLERLDGLIVGPDAARGAEVGPRFVRAPWHASLRFPEGWKTGSGPDTSAAISPSQDAIAVLVLDGKGNDPWQVVRSLEQKAGTKIDAKEISIGGRRAVRFESTERGSGGRVFQQTTWMALDGRIVRLVALCEDRRKEAWSATFDSIARSLRPAQASEIARLRDHRLRFVAAEGSEKPAQLGTRVDSAWSGEEIEAFNGLSPGQSFPANKLVKYSRSEAFRVR